MSTACTIKFDTDNAAFTDGEGPSEASAILRRIAIRIDNGHDSGVIHDSNGNRIGVWNIDYPEADA